MKKELANLICNTNNVWSKLLTQVEFGNFAPSIWKVALAADEITLNETAKRFQFNNAQFSFDVNLEEPDVDGVNYISTIAVSGKGIYALNEKNQPVSILDLTLDKI